ncbi:MAG: ATP-binding protein, partial [Lachnospiraceae bacterium]|nr:ATP-binding protein [Lachnospiraceae bacterium]
LSIVSVLFEEHDLRGLRQILRSVLFISFGPCLIIAILVFVFAPQIVGIFGGYDFEDYPVFELIYIISIFILAWAKHKHFPSKMMDYLLLPEDFDIESDKVIDVNIESSSEVVCLSKKSKQFCMDNGVDNKKANYISLIVEEMAVNIFEHGTTNGKTNYVDMKIIILPDKIKLRLRDNCKPFNPKERAEMLNDNIGDDVGLKIVSKISKKMDYVNLFNMNQTMIEL